VSSGNGASYAFRTAPLIGRRQPPWTNRPTSMDGAV